MTTRTGAGRGADADAMDTEMLATCQILESIAKRYPRGSAESNAIREAAYAFIYLRQHEGLKKNYAAFRRRSGKPLTKAQKQVMKRAGVTR